jgi:Fe-S-cluster containining protein
MSEIDTQYRISKFVCRRCGACCKGEGIVRLEPEEVCRMADEFEMTPEDFAAKYTILAEWDGRILIDKYVGEERWCVFLHRDRNGLHSCRVQGAKPSQCVGFPYKWRSSGAFQWCEGLKE